MVKRIFAWQTDTAGCFFYRLYLPLTHLSTDDWSVAWGAPGPDLHNNDVVIGQRIAGYSPEWLNVCKDPNVLAVYDIDDDLLNIDPANTVPYSIYAPIRDDTAKNIAAADVVTVSTPKLAEYLTTINPRVVVLPNCVPPDLPYRTRIRSERLTVGWAGSMFHHQDWISMPAYLDELRRRVPYVSFHMIGADYTAGVVPTRVTGWSTIENYYNSLNFDIGIAPITRSPFNERKSWIKLLEYASLGIPAVATDAGQYPEWITHGVNGFLVTRDTDWVDYMFALTDDQLRLQMSDAALGKAREYTIDKQVHRWADAYSGKV
jgi:glycosyltransferase involved in cell wall biosynthesis